LSIWIRISRLSGCRPGQPTSADAKQAAALHAERPQGPVPPWRVQAADALTFTVALALVAFCIVPAPRRPGTKAPTEQAKTPALIG
jgi:pectin methylesterase-like acyl-CoA thioesterase